MDTARPVVEPPVRKWERLAADGKLEDAVVAYVEAQDWVTFVELQRVLKPFMETEGTITIELPGNMVLWAGMSQPFADLIVKLRDANRVHYHGACTLTYLIDGGVMPIPVVKQVRAGGYKKLHWLPTCLRTVPLRKK